MIYLLLKDETSKLFYILMLITLSAWPLAQYMSKRKKKDIDSKTTDGQLKIKNKGVIVLPGTKKARDFYIPGLTCTPTNQYVLYCASAFFTGAYPDALFKRRYKDFAITYTSIRSVGTG